MAAFEQPFQPLLQAGVRFYATLGNHDKASSPSADCPLVRGGEVMTRLDTRAFLALLVMFLGGPEQHGRHVHGRGHSLGAA
jgi:DNA repair exonuclease SbcCD nuclease subunit